ncbi:MAG: sugar phosphate isomerase/epimerase [Clostridia bacterium]|nr:sugar phosphate isomerase/epimerase [Clostridia bacterium]
MLNSTPAMAGWFGYPLELDERLRLISEAGFRSVLLWWAVESAFEPSIPHKVETAHRHGLDVENAHLQFARMNTLWEDGIDGESYANELIGLVASAATYGVPTLVVHLTRTSTPPGPNELGYSRFMRMVDTAERVGVDLAFENLKRPDRLYDFMALAKSPRIGVCFDAGHNHYVCPERRVCRDFAPFIKAVHLHDNFGTSDDHLIPFDGNEDWELVRREIIDSAYTGAWSLEIEHALTDKFGKQLSPNDPYGDMPPEEYLARAFAAHKRLTGGSV